MSKKNGMLLALIPADEEEACPGVLRYTEINKMCDNFWEKRGVKSQSFRENHDLFWKKRGNFRGSAGGKPRNGGEKISGGKSARRPVDSSTFDKEGLA
jgi:hypothetical protein